MEAFFFGSGNHQVFAVYHPPVQDGGEVLTVICPPLFADYMRTQLALRELAVSLAARGQHVLRLDYRGTGDSFGELGDVGISDWVEDVAATVKEGRDLTGSSVVRLLGVRAGALIACKSAEASGDVQRFVLWDPVPDGTSYLRTLRRVQEMMIQQNYYLSRAERGQVWQEYSGYVIPDHMLEEFGSLDASIYSRIPGDKLHVVCTSSESGFFVHGIPVEIAPFTCDWDTLADDLIMPRPVLERLIACLELT
jgi:pimeloyl-ACP methyl ester carboxylesterase